MCGIIAHCGSGNVLPQLLTGLERLEYRGYDSAGAALWTADGVRVEKTAGPIAALREKICAAQGFTGKCGIAHTRWATHGAPTGANAHPHRSMRGLYTVVHNGIIENARVLREDLLAQGYTFRSETDTEVLADLLETLDTGDALQTMQIARARMQGSFAVCVLYARTPDVVYCMRVSSPLLLAQFADGFGAASDLPALTGCRGMYRMREGETACCTASQVRLFDPQGQQIAISFRPPEDMHGMPDKGGYSTYLEKEIAEQPEAAARTLAAPFSAPDRPSRMVFIGCGSAYHAASFGASLLQSRLHIPCTAALASEFRYDDVPLDGGTIAVCVSQSGETADTLAALRCAREKGARTLSIVNVPGSSMTAEGGQIFLTQAGQEISVATTKAYCAQLAAMLRLCAALDGSFRQDFTALPQLLRQTLETRTAAHALAERYYEHGSAYFIGRGFDRITAMEGALKLRELCYMDAHAYAAGELKHGTLSLIGEGTLCVAVCCAPDRADKTISNIEEVRARGGEVICVTTQSLRARLPQTQTLVVPDAAAPFLPLLAVVPLQFFAKSCAFFRKCAIDQPRNLAKSVTVE